MIRRMLILWAISIVAALSPIIGAEASCSLADQQRYQGMGLTKAEIDRLCPNGSAVGATGVTTPPVGTGTGVTTFCVTELGLRCLVPQAQRNSSCYCNTQSGPVQGIMQ